MNITIQCSCGAAYDVEFEPVDGQVPGTIGCPSCGADATDYANRMIATATTAPRLAAEKVPAEPPAPVAPADEASSRPLACARHPAAPAAVNCFVCKKPMCQQCLEQFGFVCSPYCRQRSLDLRLEVPVYEHQRDLVAARARSRTRLLSAVALGLVGCLLGLWGWYQFVGAKPHLAWSLSFAPQDRPQSCQFAGPEQVLLLRRQTLTLYDIARGRELWSAAIRPLPPPPAAAEPGAAREPGSVERGSGDFGFAADDPVHVAGPDVWVECPGGLLRLDRQTGQEKGRVPIAGQIERVSPTAAAILVVARTGGGEQVLTQIALGTGQVQRQRLPLPLIEPPAAPRSLPGADDSTEAFVPDPVLTPWRREFVPAGPNVVRFEARLLKTNIVTSQAMKPEGPSAVSSEVRVTETAAMAEDVLNEMQRRKTAGLRKDDASTYAVSLQRLFGPAAAEWQGEVIGRPALFAAATVDLLVAGQTLSVFDKTNRKLWETKLTYPIDPRFAEAALATEATRPVEAASASPGLEAGQTLYFFDQGVLTAFAVDSGAVRWRLPSVGISRLSLDDQGLLYVSTTSASPESIQYTQQINVRDKVVPIILKIDPATGKTLWKIKQRGQACYLSGRILYFTSAQTSGLETLAYASRGTGAPPHFRLYRIAPGTGEPLWEYYQPREPVRLDFAGTRILLLFPGELQVLKFLVF